MNFYYEEELIQLLPEKAAFLPQHGMLLIADVHLGKASHFRKAGIIIPVPETPPDLHFIANLIAALKPKTVVFLGDLFHSSLNNEWWRLKEFLDGYSHLRFILTKGNHDILPSTIMEETSIEVVDELEVGPYLMLTHEPMTIVPEGKLNIAGHVHPGVLLKGRGRQQYRLACFYYHNHCLILPAFGKLTGLHVVKKNPGAEIYPVFPEEVIALP